jgi:hypothetical protein
VAGVLCGLEHLVRLRACSSNIIFPLLCVKRLFLSSLSLYLFHIGYHVGIVIHSCCVSSSSACVSSPCSAAALLPPSSSLAMTFSNCDQRASTEENSLPT